MRGDYGKDQNPSLGRIGTFGNHRRHGCLPGSRIGEGDPALIAAALGDITRAAVENFRNNDAKFYGKQLLRKMISCKEGNEVQHQRNSSTE
jgi:hypothetical protein